MVIDRLKLGFWSILSPATSYVLAAIVSIAILVPDIFLICSVYRMSINTCDWPNLSHALTDHASFLFLVHFFDYIVSRNKHEVGEGSGIWSAKMLVRGLSTADIFTSSIWPFIYL
jgi:hypothetical protein